MINQSKITLALLLTLGLTANIANATIVRIETSLGSIDINLYDETTPASVANFLNYITAGSYDNTLFHRSINGFILQGGGFIYDSSWPPGTLQTNPTVNNEPIYSNVRGTIAYAKLGGQPNSATSQWFFNLVNNGANLDNQNGGFTVFGEVMGNGMDIIDSIVALNTYNLTPTFAEIPLQNYTTGTDPNDTNIILITSIDIIDSAVNTASGLNPPATTRTEPGSNTSSGGGSFGTVLLMMLLTITRIRKK
ncbi:MAG: peptidylprolyl isomerase [Kangiella sp.]|nr:MAG: peptidylprolyl isomerase [Kangiella sp.]